KLVGLAPNATPGWRASIGVAASLAVAASTAQVAPPASPTVSVVRAPPARAPLVVKLPVTVQPAPFSSSAPLVLDGRRDSDAPVPTGTQSPSNGAQSPNHGRSATQHGHGR